MRIGRFILPALFACLMQPIVAQDAGRKSCCMFYNVENLFHPSDDPGPGDDDFTPGTVRHWSFYRYNRKIAQLCKVILAVGGWDPPQIICLCEIENRQVLEDIVRHPLLLHHHYEILHRESHDHRGIDVGILYQPAGFTCIDTSWISITDQNGETIHTREILGATFTADRDTLLCLANHWTSKYGGASETEPYRILQAQHLLRFINEAKEAIPGLKIIAGGDLNDSRGSRPLIELTAPGVLHPVLPPVGQNTYKYQGKWGSVDHVFAGGELLPGQCRAAVYAPAFLLEKDEKHTGMRPRRTFRGYAYNGGISDHLPLLVYFRVR